MEPITLFAKDASGQLRYWEISSVDCDIIIEYGKVGGEPIFETEEVLEGKAGRSIEEQIMLRINSRVKKKKDAGYVHNIDDARNNKRTNSLGFVKPMLAAKYEQCQDLVKDFEFAIQNKYDGFRCLITKQGGDMFAYTRGGQLLTTIGHIVDELSDIPEGVTIDGELYNHGMTLQAIASAVKRDRPTEDSKKIKFMAYDIVEDCVYSERWKMLADLLLAKYNTELVPTLFNIEANNIPRLLKERRNQGYEGLIIRLDISKVGRNIKPVGYEDSKRSKSLIKVKAWEDEEFLVVDAELSEKGRAVLWCITEKGKKFKVVPFGSMMEKEQVIINKKNYVGRHLKVEFANYTKDGVPFQPVAICWREKFSE